MGDNAIIGANAVVINDVLSDCVVADVPAKVVSRDSSHSIDEEYYGFLGWGENMALH